MTTEQEKKWREGFNKVAPACGYILDRDQDGWYEYQSTAWAWEIYKAACQSMQAEYAENLKSLEKQMRDHIEARFEVLAKEKIKELEAELEKERAVVDWYADENNYNHHPVSSHPDCMDFVGFVEEKKAGEKARARQKERW